MEADIATRHPEACPFLIPVMADRLWMYPMPAYCRRPDGRVRVPAGSRVDCICMTTAHLVCAGYLQARDRELAWAAGPA